MTNDQNPRIEMLTEQRAAEIAREYGMMEELAPLSVFRILLQHPELANQLQGTLKQLLFEGNLLDPRLRELIIMRIGWSTGSVYEWTQHWRLSMDMEIAEADLIAVRDWHQDKSVLSDDDRVILQAVDDTLEQGKISDATWSRCIEILGTAQERIELVVAIGNWTMFSQLLRSLQVPLEEGVAAWPPDGKAPQG